jgi:hypothetical protein
MERDSLEWDVERTDKSKENRGRMDRLPMAERRKK